MAAVKAVRNIWGNYGCFIGAERVETMPTEFDATHWMMETLDGSSDHVISPKSDIGYAEVNLHRAKLK